MATTKSIAPNKLADNGKPSAEQALRKALEANPNATTADLAAAAGVGRSTAGKVLADLARSGCDPVEIRTALAFALHSPIHHGIRE